MQQQTDSRYNLSSKPAGALRSPSFNFCARWGCYYCSLLAAAEHIAGRELSEDDFYKILGLAVLKRWMLHANYSNHADPQALAKSWGPKDDPEYHYYVNEPAKMLQCALERLRHPFTAVKVTFSTSLPPAKWAICEYEVFGGSHFVLQRGEQVLYNPDVTIDLEGRRLDSARAIEVI